MKNFQRMLFFALFIGVFVFNSNMLAMENKVEDFSCFDLRLEVIRAQLKKLNISEKDTKEVLSNICEKVPLMGYDKQAFIKLIRSIIPKEYLYKTEQIQKDLVQRISKLASTSCLDLSSVFKNYKYPYLAVKILNTLFGLLYDLEAEIKEINLSQNGLTILPRSLFKLNSLEKLHLSENRLTRLSIDLLRLENLKFLDLSHNNIWIFDFLSILERLDNLETLDLNGHTYGGDQDVLIQQKLQDINVNLGVDYYSEHLKCCS